MNPALPTAEALAEFAEAFARLESAAGLYPESHARSREAATRFSAARGTLAGGNGTLVVESSEERLLVGAVSCALSTRTIRMFHAKLESLGIARLEIDAAASCAELHGLATLTRAASQRESNASSLQPAELGDLPPTIRVRHRDFGWGAARDAWSAAPQETASSPTSLDSVVEIACGPLAADGVGETTRSAAREWVKQSMQRIAERVEKATPSPDSGGIESPHRTLDEVLQLAGRTMEFALNAYLADSTGNDSLQRMFQSIETATARCDDPQSARLMVEVLHESAEDVLGGAEPPELEDLEQSGEEFQLDLDELKRRLAQLAPGLADLGDLRCDDRCETFAIILNELVFGTEITAVGAIAKTLRDRLAPPWTDGEKQTLLSGLKTLCACGDERRIDVALPPLVATLGDEQLGQWLGAAAEAAATLGPAELAALWPHLACEVLLGPRGRCEVALVRVLAQVGRLPKERLAACMKRLLVMPALAHGTISDYVFANPSDEFAPFIVAMLETRHAGDVGAHLLTGLKRRPPTWNGAVVFQCFSRFDTDCCDLMRALFAAGGPGQVQPATKKEIRRVLAQRITALPIERAGESWVPRAIEALAGPRTVEIERALQRVLGDRKHVFLSPWPAACRAAAQRALGK